jgi:hypothetical protein
LRRSRSDRLETLLSLVEVLHGWSRRDEVPSRDPGCFSLVEEAGHRWSRRDEVPSRDPGCFSLGEDLLIAG